MDLDGVFAELDGVGWEELEHAYGEAEDVPAMLRGLVGDEGEASEALGELWGSIVHQGTVYEATAAAVPFLARLAAGGVRTVDLLVLLGAIAESTDECGVPQPGACRSAVAAQLPLVLPLCRAADEEVRRAAVWTAGRTGDASALAVLRERWAREAAAGVRAELLAALAHVDPAASTALALGALAADVPGEVRLVAVMACVDAGLPFGEVHHETLLSLLPADPLVSGRFDEGRSEPLHYVVDALLMRDSAADREAAYELVEAALALVDPAARAEALWAAEHACLISRGAPPRLAPVVVALLTDPSFPHTASVLPVLETMGAHAAAGAPALGVLADGEGELADRALEVLARLAPEQAARLLARDLGGRSGAVDAITKAVPLPYAPELLNAIRIELTATAETVGAVDAAERAAPSRRRRLTELLTAWGPQASAALPELTVLFGRSPALFAGALAAVCPPERRAETAELLRGAAGAGPVDDRYAAAEALYGLTGESALLVAALRDALAVGAQPREVAVVEAAGRLGDAGAALVPYLRSALTPAGTHRVVHELDVDVAVALALWRLTGRSQEPLSVLGGVLAEARDREFMTGSVRRCALAAAELGTAAAPLEPALASCLTEPQYTPAAVLALHAMGAAPADAAALALTCVEKGVDAMTALDALESLGSGARTAEDTARLVALAERDLRIWATRREGQLVAVDERLRERAARLLSGASSDGAR
ncbi:HEAT repeat domain-containing protein [Streptomyces sp. NPDC047315]|uniref:HEAT repeat domain-containing protein n=1 Tax=Streptomyces sp. NPDC047315 TaxID=3155142 RepID=UPI0033EFBE2A